MIDVSVLMYSICLRHMTIYMCLYMYMRMCMCVREYVCWHIYVDEYVHMHFLREFTHILVCISLYMYNWAMRIGL